VLVDEFWGEELWGEGYGLGVELTDVFEIVIGGE
jgi:hypothetical protein